VFAEVIKCLHCVIRFAPLLSGKVVIDVIASFLVRLSGRNAVLNENLCTTVAHGQDELMICDGNIIRDG
jgi:hypothetical protein